MKVTIKVIHGETTGNYKKVKHKKIYLEDEVHYGIARVRWESDRVILISLDAKIQQISYRKDLVFAVIEEEEQ